MRSHFLVIPVKRNLINVFMYGFFACSTLNQQNSPKTRNQPTLLNGPVFYIGPPRHNIIYIFTNPYQHQHIYCSRFLLIVIAAQIQLDSDQFSVVEAEIALHIFKHRVVSWIYVLWWSVCLWYWFNHWQTKYNNLILCVFTAQVFLIIRASSSNTDVP